MSLDPVVLAISRQHASFSLSWDNHIVNIFAIYACTTHILRRELWLELTSLQQNHLGPWLFFGDFNVVLGANKKKGGCLAVKISCDEFRTWSDVLI